MNGPTPEQSPSPQPLVSVVLPCLNEAEGVGETVREARGALEQLAIPHEVLVVDNGSTDDSRRIAEEAGARVVEERRRGYGSAYLRGFQAARGKFLVMADADRTYPLQAIGEFLVPLIENDADFVIGSRFKGRISPGAMSWSHRWIGNPILSGMLRIMFHTSVSDAHCGMRAMNRHAYEQMRLRTTGMEFASEMVVSALRGRLRIKEVPIEYRRRAGESKLVGLRDAWRHVQFMLIYSPSYLFQLPGLLLMLVGALLVGLLAGGPRVIFGHQWEYHPLLFGVAALILGYNLVLFDLLAKSFSMGAGFAASGKWLKTFFRWFTLERGLIAGTVAFLFGLGLEVKIVFDWVHAGFGPLMAVRGIAIGMGAMVMGLQTVFASFLLSLMTVARR